MTALFDLARTVNVILGPIAFACLCYRTVLGLHEGAIVYRPLFVLFCGYVLYTLLGAPTGIVIGVHATYLQLLALLLNGALIVTCVFYPGPLRRKA